MSDPNTMYVLCCVDDFRWWGIPPLPSFGAFRLPDEYPDGVSHPGLTGLAYGLGNPDLANFQQGADFFVIRVAAADATLIEDLWGPISAVRFKRGFVIYRGDRRGALETLLLFDADRGALAAQLAETEVAIRLALPGNAGVARAGAWGVAVGGRSGYATSGDDGISVVGDFGVARSGARGAATVDGQCGLAVAGSGGAAKSDADGISVIQGYRGRASTGDGGIAVGLRDIDHLETHDNGIAVARGHAGFVQTGDGAIVVVGAADAISGPKFRVGDGTLVVARISHDEDAGVSYAVAVAGYRGFGPNTTYQLRDGQYRPCADAAGMPTADCLTGEPKEIETPNGQSSEAPVVEAGLPWCAHARAASPDALIREVTPPATAVVVLQRQDERETGPISVRKPEGDSSDDPAWDPDPSSTKGIFGLAWGCGDPSRLGVGNAWSLVIVEKPVRVPTEAGGCVKYERGEVVYCGTLPGALAALEALGVDPKDMAIDAIRGNIAYGGDHAQAFAGNHGWAIGGYHAEAGDFGYAETTNGGYASVGWNGVARAGEGGEVFSRGVAVSFARYSKLFATDLAVATGQYVNVTSLGIAVGGVGKVECAGLSGIAIGANRAQCEQRGIAIARDLNGHVSGAQGALLVVRNDLHPSDWVFGIVGENGIEANEEYCARRGALVRTSSMK